MLFWNVIGSIFNFVSPLYFFTWDGEKRNLNFLVCPVHVKKWRVLDSMCSPCSLLLLPLLLPCPDLHSVQQEDGEAPWLRLHRVRAREGHALWVTRSRFSSHLHHVGEWQGLLSRQFCCNPAAVLWWALAPSRTKPQRVDASTKTPHTIQRVIFVFSQRIWCSVTFYTVACKREFKINSKNGKKTHAWVSDIQPLPAIGMQGKCMSLIVSVCACYSSLYLWSVEALRACVYIPYSLPYTKGMGTGKGRWEGGHLV